MSEQKQAPIVEVLARAIVTADERDGGPPWGWHESMGGRYERMPFERAAGVIGGLAAAGYVIVPLEPTEAMKVAVYNQGADMANDPPDAIWRAMVEANR